MKRKIPVKKKKIRTPTYEEQMVKKFSDLDANIQARVTDWIDRVHNWLKATNEELEIERGRALAFRSEQQRHNEVVEGFVKGIHDVLKILAENHIDQPAPEPEQLNKLPQQPGLASVYEEKNF